LIDLSKISKSIKTKISSGVLTPIEAFGLKVQDGNRKLNETMDINSDSYANKTGIEEGVKMH